MISRWILLRMRSVSDKIVQKIKTPILWSILPPPLPKIVPFLSDIWKNNVQPDRPHMAIRHMRVAWWITWATNTHTEYAILIAFPHNNGCTNAAKCHVIRKVSVLFYFGCFANWATGMGFCEIWQSGNGVHGPTSLKSTVLDTASHFVAKTAVVGMEQEGSFNGNAI